MADFFALLGLPSRFALDPKDLEQRYRDLSQRFHPDKFATAPAPERRQALERSTALNDAYRTLKDPLRRAVYVFKLHGISLDAEGPEGRSAVALSPEFLEAFLDVREAFEAQLSEAADTERARELRREMQQRMIGERMHRLTALARDLEALPEAATRAQLMPLAQRLLELRYYDRFTQELEEDLEEDLEASPNASGEPLA